MILIGGIRRVVLLLLIITHCTLPEGKSNNTININTTINTSSTRSIIPVLICKSYVYSWMIFSRTVRTAALSSLNDTTADEGMGTRLDSQRC